MKHRIFFITGVNGVGKTSVIEPLRALLGAGFDVRDFDERGVPDNVKRQWRLDEAQYWIELGKKNIKNKITTIICGFAKPSEITEPSVAFILLDAVEDTLKQRLWKRYQTPESIATIERIVGKSVQKFIDDNIYYSSVMRQEAKQSGGIIIDTTDLTPEQVAQEILSHISLG